MSGEICQNMEFSRPYSEVRDSSLLMKNQMYFKNIYDIIFIIDVKIDFN